VNSITDVFQQNITVVNDINTMYRFIYIKYE